MPAPSLRARARRLGALVAAAVILLPLVGAAEDPPPESAPPPETARALAEARAFAKCSAAAGGDVARAVSHRGRSALEISGRADGAGVVGPWADRAVFDRLAARIVLYTCFANASRRRDGEAILSLPEITARADALVKTLLPRFEVALESVERLRVSGQEQVYYEARFTSLRGEPPFFDPPVRLLFDASTGSLFQVDLDPDWLAPAPPPRVMISRKAAERIAAVVVAALDLAAAFGPGTALVGVGTAELRMVRPNAIPGLGAGDPDAGAQPAWVVPLRLQGANAPAPVLFVGAAGGKVLGGSTGAALPRPASLPGDFGGPR